MPKSGVVVAYPHPHYIDAAFHQSVTNLLLWDARHQSRVVTHGDLIQLATSPRIAAARNEIVRVFLAHPTQPEWLWFIDADMVFAPDTLERLLAAADPTDRPIVGGLCFIGGRGARVTPTIYVLVRDNGKLGVEGTRSYPKDKLIQVDATGAACLLIHRSALERIGEHYPGAWFADNEAIGEDVAFCLRARHLGVPIHVDTRIKIGHMKPVSIDEHTYDTYQAAVAEHGTVKVQQDWLDRRGLWNTICTDEREHAGADARQ